MLLSFKRPLLAALLALSTAGAGAAELTVSAAASLTDAFKEIAQAYEKQHPGDKVLLNFAASGALLQQMAKGAPVDVFASADGETMDAAVKQGLVKAADRKDFARNALVLVVPTNATPFKTLDQLRAPNVTRIAIGNPASVPVGRYTRDALDAAGLWTALMSKIINTTNVRQALDYVARGEVDAGFVYATDARQFRDKVRVAFEVPLARPVIYPIARTSAAGAPIEAARFVAWVLSPAGQAILARYGFQKP